MAGRPPEGRWSRAYFESKSGLADRPLNALELLSLMKTAAHVTGDAKYEAEYRKAAFDLKFMNQTTRL
jgi:hypothetical protein